jgi:hypothetical protein
MPIVNIDEEDGDHHARPMPNRFEYGHQGEERQEPAGVDPVDLRQVVNEGFAFPLHAHVLVPLSFRLLPRRT